MNTPHEFMTLPRARYTTGIHCNTCGTLAGIAVRRPHGGFTVRSVGEYGMMREEGSAATLLESTRLIRLAHES